MALEQTTAGWKAVLDDIAEALRRLHKTLVDEEAAGYARDIGPIAGPAHLLKLLTTHEHFAWLRVLSELMVSLDELRSGGMATLTEAGALRSTIEGLVGPRPASVPHFRSRYIVLIQMTPEVAMAHHALRQALQRLPSGDSETTSDDLHERHVETEAEKHEPVKRDD